MTYALVGVGVKFGSILHTSIILTPLTLLSLFLPIQPLTRLGLEHVAFIGSEMIKGRDERGVYIIFDYR